MQTSVSQVNTFVQYTEDIKKNHVETEWRKVNVEEEDDDEEEKKLREKHYKKKERTTNTSQRNRIMTRSAWAIKGKPRRRKNQAI